MKPSPRPTPGHGDRPDGADAATQFAEVIERTFLEDGRSLTHPETAHVYGLTLNLVTRLLEGSHARGVIDASQLGELTASVDGMKQAPGLI